MKKLSHAYWIASILSSILVAGCSTTTSPTPSNSSLPGGTIYFYENAVGIETLNLSSGTVTTVAVGDDPNVRPDGWILGVFDNNLAVVSPDGAQEKVIVVRNNQAPFDVTYDDHFHDPQLSPDQKYIAYDDDALYERIYIVDATTGALVATIGNVPKSEFFAHPSWGRDGSLYFQSVPFGSTQPVGGIFKLDPTFQNVTRVDPNLNNPSKPSVSPDGSSVAFTLNNHIWTMTITGANPKQLTTSSGTEDCAAWSSDSKWVAINNGACDIILIPIGAGTPISMDTQFPTTMGNVSHCVSGGSQMDWK